MCGRRSENVSTTVPATRNRAVPRLAKRRLEQLMEEAKIDAYGESEQRLGLLTTLEENIASPFMTEIFGTPVCVERVDLKDAHEIMPLCCRGHQTQVIPILKLPLLSPPPAGWMGMDRSVPPAGR
jgi:hypothetical protein